MELLSGRGGGHLCGLCSLTFILSTVIYELLHCGLCWAHPGPGQAGLPGWDVLCRPGCCWQEVPRMGPAGGSWKPEAGGCTRAGGVFREEPGWEQTPGQTGETEPQG